MKLIYESVLHTETSEIGDVYEVADGKFIFLVDSGTSSRGKKSWPCEFETPEDACKTTEQHIGIFKHYKGGVYMALATDVVCDSKIAADSGIESLGVVYKHMYPHEHAIYWRPKKMFNEPDRFNLVISDTLKH